MKVSYSILGAGNIECACGGKAYGLHLLNSVGLQIPETLIIPYKLHISDYKYKIQEFIDSVVAKYGKAKFAIRSSASNEDGSDNSWAGMYDTKLSVAPENVFETILQMYYYSSTARKEAYSVFANSTSKTEMSLVVQRMIESTVSGVCFTTNPINGNYTEIIIEAVEGLGDKLVSGLVTPQMYIVSESGNCILFDNGDYIGVNLLSDCTLYNFARQIIYIKNVLYQEADIEFALHDGQIFFLQIRPITKTYKAVV